MLCIYKSIASEIIYDLMRKYSPQQMKWHYEYGLLLESMYKYAVNNNNEVILQWIIQSYDNLVGDDGKIKNYDKNEYNLDQINPGKVLFDVFKVTGNTKYRKAIECLREQLRRQPRTESLGFWHKKIYPWQIWLDGVFMQAPFYARYALEFGTADDFEDVLLQVLLVLSKVRDPKTELLYHAWDESRKQLWANQQTGCSLHFLGRGMGLFCMAIVDVLDYIPEYDQYKTYRQRLITSITRLFPAVLRVQDESSGMWYQILDQGSRERNFLETSASSMFVYFLLKSLRKGYIPSASCDCVKNSAVKGFEGICRAMLTKDSENTYHLHGICTASGLGGNPYRDGSFEYYVREKVATDAFHGIGPFIAASAEIELLL